MASLSRTWSSSAHAAPNSTCRFSERSRSASSWRASVCASSPLAEETSSRGDEPPPSRPAESRRREAPLSSLRIVRLSDCRSGEPVRARFALEPPAATPPAASASARRPADVSSSASSACSTCRESAASSASARRRACVSASASSARSSCSPSAAVSASSL
ncbi:hypothetical protein T492DRAFT_1090428 [Pavlovales sp. CCMP2436]|nr:hypothetical protein T492DRAFT_1090428 [Pavlovales sp. CCMP2436]